MQKNLIKVIIFDLDDTLYEDRTFVKSGFEAVSKYVKKNFGINKKGFFKVLLDIFKKEGRGHVFDIALQKNNLYNKKLVDKLVKVYRSHKPNIKLYPGVKKLLKSLKKRYKLALITDGLGYVQRNKVKALNIEKYFNLIIYTDDRGQKKSKPHPYSFKKVLNHFEIKPKEAICIGDDPHKDFIGAKKLGIKTVRVLQGRYKNIQVKRKFEADYNVSKITKIKSLLKNS
jgi:putative hydrolase of the HAD superfamily